MRRRESACRVDGGLEVLCQFTIATNAGEEALDDPAPRIDREADLIGVLAHDFDRIKVVLAAVLPAYPLSSKTHAPTQRSSVLNASSDSGIEAAFADLLRSRTGALLVGGTPRALRTHIAKLGSTLAKF
jgi:hypothetical protein